MKIKTEYWESTDPEKRVMPFWTLMIYSTGNCGYAFYTEQIGLLVLNFLFMLMALLSILSFNKWKKMKREVQNANIKTGEKEQSKENQSTVQ